MVKKVFLSTLVLITALFVFNVSAFAGESIFRLKTTWAPKQEVSLTPPGALSTDFDIDHSFGGYGEWGKESPSGWLYAGLEAGFVNLSAGNPIAGVSEVEVQEYSLMAKLCANLVNESTFTPYVCGGAGLAFFDPSTTTGGVATVNIDQVTTSAYALEAGIRMKPYGPKKMGFIAGYRYDNTFEDPNFSVAGGGPSAKADLARNSLFIGIEF